MHQQHVTRLVALLALAVAGCGGGATGASVVCGPPECAADATLLLVAEVDPPSDSTLVRQEFGSVTIDERTGLFALALDQQVTLSGKVRVGTTGGLSSTPAATVVATRPSRIIGRPDVVYQAAVSPIDGSYVLVVSRNINAEEKYSLRVSTTDTSLTPPETVSVVADADKEVDVTLDAPLTLPELHGTVLDSLQKPVAGMQVQATTLATASSSSTVVSTTTTTDASGAFSIRLVSGPPGKVMLTATPTGLISAVLPSLARVVDTTKLSAVNSLTAGLTMPPLPAAVQVHYNVEGISTSGATMPVTAATCTFTADVSDPKAADGTTAQYQTSSMTDPASGQVTVQLIPAESGNRTYAVTITPDPAQLFASRMLSLDVATGGYGADIMLNLRSQLSGRVLGSDGKPLSSLMVVPAPATVAASLQVTPSTVASTPQQATASNDGRFSLRLDPGNWDVGLVPPADAMLPRLWLSELDLQGDLDVGSVLIPAGVMVHGVVHDPSGAALPHANVRIYTVSSGNAACAPTDQQCLAPPRLRAETTSGSDGIVAVILPSQPQQ